MDAASEVVVGAQDPGLSMDERRRVLEANTAALQYFRRELLRAPGGWPLDYLRAHGVESVLSPASPWKVGYAPPAWSNLVDHLRDQGFGYGTLVRAGLMVWNEHDEAIDRHRDKLMVVARDRRLAAVGFVGIGSNGDARSATPVSAIHRPSNVLVGIEEQRDLLSRGAVPVIVDSPMDAIAVSNAGLQAGGLWSGIPVSGGGLSASQAKTLKEFSATDKVIVAIGGSQAERNQSAGYLLDLAFYFDRVRGIDVPSGQTLSDVAKAELGVERLNDVLRDARPLMTYRATGRGFAALQSTDLDPPAPGL